MKVAKKLVYTENAMSEDRAFMLLVGHIGYTEDSDGLPVIDGSRFAEEMYYLQSLGLNVTVKINSPGGRTFDMMTIIDAIETVGANTHIIGMAASAAGIISQYGKKRFMNDSATLMVHPLQKNGAPENYVSILHNQIKGMLLKRSNLTDAQAEEMLANGAKDTWMDASDAFNRGLCDEVVQTNGKKVENLKNYWNPNSAKQLVSIYNSINNSPHNEKEEMKGLKKLLGLSEDATETQIMEKVGELQVTNKSIAKKAETLEAEKVAAEKSKSDIEGELKTYRETAADVLVTNAVENGIIEEDKKSAWREMAVSNYANTKELLDGVKPQGRQSAADAAKTGNHAGKGGKSTETDEIPSFEKMQVEDPEGLKKIEKEQPELFEKMVAVYATPIH
jgi:ATP-dependent protease ClpP protease subunit